MHRTTLALTFTAAQTGEGTQPPWEAPHESIMLINPFNLSRIASCYVAIPRKHPKSHSLFQRLADYFCQIG